MDDEALPAAFGRYLPVAKLGAGAIGTVFRAHDPLIGRFVAVKTIRLNSLDADQKAEYRERFHTEAQAGGRCAHPGIIAIFDAGEAQGQPYLVMEYVEGSSLHSILADPAARAALNPAELMSELLEALGYAHARGIIHRDIKPANIMLTPDQRVKVADFGIARLDGASRTQIGTLLGTPGYMAPEQARGAAVDHRTDLFSAAAILFALLTGAAPFAGPTLPGTLLRLTDDSEADLSALAGPLEIYLPVLRQGLAKNPAQRFPDAAAFAAALRAAGQAPATLLLPPLARPNNLPARGGALIGREAELAELRALLAAHRLVTLLGPGGIGKTRLALQAAADALADYVDGAWLVELAGITQAGEVAPAAAAALSISLSGRGAPEEQLATALRGATMLIILDNCEHLVEAAAALAAAVLRRNPGITLLATSRSPLGLPGEQSFALPTLAVPEANSLPGITAEAAAGYAGIELFVARAALVQPGFTLDATNAADIASICQRLDGIALAIELAAARIRLLRPKELAARLDDRFRLLTGGARSHLPRQQTLRALIDWSFNLLNPAERVAFRRLGVFVGSFDLAGAEAVLPGGEIDAADALDLVASLLDKSLITRLPARDRAPRYRLLDSTRHYALEKLAEAGEANALHRALARHMVAVFGEARRSWRDSDTLAWVAGVEPEIENLQAALSWAFGDEGDAGIAIALSARLQRVANRALIARRTYLAHARAAAAKLAPNTPREDAAWLWFCLAGDRSAGPRENAACAESARAWFDALGDRQMAGLAASLAAAGLTRAGDAAGARRCADAARAIARSGPPNLVRAMTLSNLGFYQDISADHELARRDYAAALEIHKRFNDQAGMLIVSANLAYLQASLGDYAGAIESVARIAAQNRARRDWRNLAADLLSQTAYCLLAGDDAAAMAAAREAAPLVIELDDPGYAAELAGSLGLAAARAGALEKAALLAGYAGHFYEAHQETRQIVEQRVWDALMALVEAADAGAALTLEAALTL